MRHRTRSFAVTSLAVLAVCIVRTQSPADLLFQEGLMLERAEGKLKAAAAIYEQVIAKYPSERQVVARARTQLTEAQAKLSAFEVQTVRGSGLTSRTVLEGPNAGPYGSVSPDGKYLSFMDETRNLAVYEVATGQSRRLTNIPKGSKEVAEYSVFSPDGLQLAYGWITSAGNYELRVISLSGGEARVLYAIDQPIWVMPYHWSPEGRDILFLVAGGAVGRRLMLVPAAGGSARALMSPDWLQGNPSRAEFSPDGRFIAYDRHSVVNGARGEADVYALSVDGNREVPLLSGPGSDQFLAWYPDGKSVLVSSDRGGNRGIWIIPVEDGQPRGNAKRLMDLGAIRPMGFTKAGDFYFAQQTGAPDVYITEIDPKTGRVTKAPRLLNASAEGGRFGAAWSPDGNQIAYNIGGVASPSIGIQNVNSGIVSVIPVAMTYARNPVWAPDGTTLFFQGLDNKGRGGVFRVDPANGTAERLPIADDGLVGRVSFARGGERMFYRRGQRQLFVYDFKNSQEREILHDDRLRNFDLSPNGEFLAIRLAEPQTLELQILPAGGGERRTILRDSIASWGAGFAWAADSRYVLLNRDGELTRVPIDGGRPQGLGIKMPHIQHINANPDGHRIAFISGEMKQEIRVLQNLVALRDVRN